MNLANSIVTLLPGMYILRHPKTGMPPISVGRAVAKAEHNGQIQALYTPGTDGGVLRDRRDCIVMQVLNAPVDLLVTAYLEKAGAAVPALQIDKIQLEGAATASKPIDVPPSGISLVGHIERMGDVMAQPGKTLGNPDANQRIEGFQIMWPDKPAGVDLSYSARVEGSGETPAALTGQFCGTRNGARRMTGVTLALVGEKANNYELTGNVHFSGGFARPITDGIPVEGPTGLEHVVGISVAVAPRSSRGSHKKSNPWEPSSRTRVMKNSQAAKERGRIK